MGSTAREETMQALLDAEGDGKLLVPHDRKLRRRLERMVEKREAFRPEYGVYVRAEYWRGLSGAQKARHVMLALSQENPSIVFSHVSAAMAHGLEVPQGLLRKVHVLTWRGHETRSSGWVVRHVSPECQVVEVGGIRVTSLEQTAFDCLRTLDLPEGLAVADSVLRKEGYDAGALRDLFEEQRQRRGRRHAAQTLDLADCRSENGGESIARGVMLELGFMPPELQVEINDLYSDATYRADYLWRVDESLTIVGELDGKDKYVNSTMTRGKDINDVLLDERLRESRISAKGYRIMRFRFSEVRNRQRFAELLELFGVPRGYPLPERLPHPSLDDGMTFRRYKRASQT